MSVIITGGTKGIGKAIAKQFAKEGFNIAICARTAADLKKVKKTLLAINPNIEVLTMQVDIQSKKQVEKFAYKVLKKWDKIEILVNNAATFTQGTIIDEPSKQLENTLQINLIGAYHLTKKILPHLINQKKGHIFNICSVASKKVYPNCSSYVISKFALLGFSKALRQELMDKQIKVTAVMPGATLTDSWAGVTLPKNRIMPPKDVAKAVWSTYYMSASTTVEEIIMRPQLGDL